MKNIRHFLTLSLVALLAGSCSTDFEINAPYEDHTIVFGLLDKSDSIHYIKINKSFIGTGNAYDYAAIRDSSEYDNLEGRIEAWYNNTLISTYQLLDTELVNRDSGLFYYPYQTVYYFIAPNLNSSYEYRLVVNINEGSKEVTASTQLVNPSNFTGTIINNGVAVTFANYTSQGVSYQSLFLRFMPAEKAVRYDTWILINIEEYTSAGMTPVQLAWKQPTVFPLSLSEITIEIPGESFYQFIQNQITSNTGVQKRILRSLAFKTVGVSEDLNTYMSVNEPSTGLVQERPSFTNLSNAIGIFASRHTSILDSKFLSKNSMIQLCTGPYTQGLLFCSDSAAYSAESWYCP